jgi:hypothetical protein
MELLGKAFTQKRNERDSFYIQPILDDRMFVVSWFGHTGLAEKIKADNTYTHDDEWSEYVFVDKHKDTTIQNDWMKYDLLSQATYDRWSEYGTFFGVTRYSFVALTHNNWFGSNMINIHMRSMYFQMAMLLLAIRASILRFSDEVAAIASLSTPAEEERLGELYGRYLTFYNRLYFREVTHQDQGIELYDIGLKQMKIVEHIDKLDGKFTKLHDFASLKQNNRETAKVNRLTILGSMFVIPSIAGTLLSFDPFKPYGSWALVLSLILGGAIAWISLSSWFKGQWSRIITGVFAVAVYIALTVATADWGNKALAKIIDHNSTAKLTSTIPSHTKGGNR